MTVSQFLSGIKILEEADSPMNGKIQVVKSLGFGTYIQVEGLTQSGGVVTDVWRTVFKKVSHQSLIINHCLILGLGGGSAALLVRKFWPDAKITGVEIDPVMVELGKKHLKLDEARADIIIRDAYKFVVQNSKLKTQNYDLIIVDLYVGYKVPEKFETENYIYLVKSALASGGIAVFNRLYFGEKRKKAKKLGQKLERVFSKVDYFYPEANVMFVCRNKLPASSTAAPESPAGKSSTSRES